MGRIAKTAPNICNITTDLEKIKALFQEIEIDTPLARRGSILAISRLYKNYGKLKEQCNTARKEFGQARKDVFNYRKNNRKEI